MKKEYFPKFAPDHFSWHHFLGLSGRKERQYMSEQENRIALERLVQAFQEREVDAIAVSRNALGQ